VQSRVDSLLFRAGAGVAFTTRWGDRRFWIKPSVEYQRQTTNYTSTVASAESIGGNQLCPCRTGTAIATGESDEDLLGAGLEIEMDAVRTGDFVFSVFISGRGYRLLGERETRIDANGSFNDGQPLRFTSSVDRDPWVYATGLGVRVRWLPLPG
jgi:hypothetical protein